ncbi:MAG: ABC transporter substrate-binding protein [Candidatus Eremiobacteraeota bacterium]|nr:ABC transporter substrate-binding protein [Candidatus Eremiobacteraeota bacterium]
MNAPALELSAALTTNERTRPLLDGEVAPQAVRLLTSGLHPSEIFWRQLKHAEFDVSEMSLSSLLIATSKGDRTWAALPVFTSRTFYHTLILVRADAGIAAPADLRGKRVGVPEYQQTAAVWSRGVLQHEFGVMPGEIDWFMERTPERSHGDATGFRPPPGVTVTPIPPDRNIGSMLLDGSLDATLLYLRERNLVDRSTADLEGSSAVHPLFDAAREGPRYFAKTGIFPINHAVVVRRTLLERHPWVALNLYEAFVAAKEHARHRALAALVPYAAIGAVPGRATARDPLPYGLRENRHVLETLAGYVHEQGLSDRRVALDEVFVSSTLDV